MPDYDKGVWLATRVLSLLEQKYGPERIPSIRKLAREISAASPDARISHTQVRKILDGSVGNVTTRTLEILAQFLSVPTADLTPPSESESVAGIMAFRLATLTPAELVQLRDEVASLLQQHQTPDDLPHRSDYGA